MAVKFDERLAQEAIAGITDMANGKFTEDLQALYGVLRELGEDNEIVDVPCRDLRNIEAFYNDQCVPAYNKVIKNCEGFAELAVYVKQQLQGAGAIQGEDVGQVADATYDAARNL